MFSSLSLRFLTRLATGLFLILLALLAYRSVFKVSCRFMVAGEMQAIWPQKGGISIQLTGRFTSSNNMECIFSFFRHVLYKLICIWQKKSILTYISGLVQHYFELQPMAMLIVQLTMSVTPDPPSESASSLVSLLSRYGMCPSLLRGSTRAEMQFPVQGEMGSTSYSEQQYIWRAIFNVKCLTESLVNRIICLF